MSATGTLHVGVTGTRLRPTADQEIALRTELAKNWRRGAVLHHGSCTGTDELAHRLAWLLDYRIVVHPPTDPKFRAWVELSELWSDADLLLPVKPYMERNAEIVAVSDVLIAVPNGPELENLRSGTWATRRMALRAGVPTVVLPWA